MQQISIQRYLFGNDLSLKAGGVGWSQSSGRLVSNLWALFVCCATSACIWRLWRRKRESPLVDLPGPPPESFLLGTDLYRTSSVVTVTTTEWEVRFTGNLRELMREQVGNYDVKWQERYGMVARIKAPLGVSPSFPPISYRVPYSEVTKNDRLWISDPKAIQYISQTSRYNFMKPYAARFALNAATGPGVNGAEGGQVHLFGGLIVDV